MENNKKYIKVTRYKWPDEVATEKKKTKNIFICILACLLCLGVGFGVGNIGSSSTTYVELLGSDDTSKFEEVYNILVNDWYFGKDIEDVETFLIDLAIAGITSTEYDIHTNYLDADTAADYMSSLEGNFVGIGILYSNINDEFIIKRVYANSPAEEGGLQPGDRIQAFDGVSVIGMTSDEVADLALGEEGSSVEVEVLRDNETLTFTLVRRTINTTVYGYIDGDVGILEISSFSENSYTEVETYVQTFIDEGVESIIIDLRDNGGGYLSTCIDIASVFVDKGSVVLIEEMIDGELVSYKTDMDRMFTSDNVVILVNENTASASEALTACLQDNIGATVVGTTTYGKGTVQQPKIFTDGSYLKYTIAEWLTPNGEKINEVGITPDEYVELPLALTYSTINDDASYTQDSVATRVKDAQVFMDFLGYDVDRMDGYFSLETEVTVNECKVYLGLEADGIIDTDFMTSLIAKAQEKWYFEEDTLDTQMIRALEIAKSY